jgi:hypothetical protein
MTTIAAFNHSLKEFLGDLAATFPEKSDITFYDHMLPALLKTDQRAGLSFFMNATRDHGTQILQRDASFFDHDIYIGKGLNLTDLWNDPGLDDASKDVIWNYLNTLYVLGMTLEGVSDDMLQGIESLAQSTAEKLKSGDQSLESMLPGLMSSVGSIMGVNVPEGDDAPDFTELLNGVMGSMGGMQQFSDKKQLDQ